MIVFVIITTLIVLIIIFKSIKNAKNNQIHVIERMGDFHKIAGPGLYYINPIIDTVKMIITPSKELSITIPSFPVVTFDEIKFSISVNIYYQIDNIDEFLFNKDVNTYVQGSINLAENKYEKYNIIDMKVKFFEIIKKIIPNHIKTYGFQDLSLELPSLAAELVNLLNNEINYIGCKVNKVVLNIKK